MSEDSVLHSLTIVVLLAALLEFGHRRILSFLRYFQQEEYSTRRFIRWLGERRAVDTRGTGILALVGLVSLLAPGAWRGLALSALGALSLLAVVSLAPALALAQVPGSGQKMYRLAHITTASISEQMSRDVVLGELARLGFREGSNLVFDSRVGTTEQLPDLMQAILSAKPDAIIAVGGAAAEVAEGGDHAERDTDDRQHRHRTGHGVEEHAVAARQRVRLRPDTYEPFEAWCSRLLWGRKCTLEGILVVESHDSRRCAC
mgnify:CR=1 FL=1